jgi:hypothetical protein
MELVNKLNSIIGQLEEIRNLSDPDIDVVRKQVDDFENEILPKLDEEFDELRSRIYDEGDPDEAAEKLMDQIGDQFIQADALINTIREQFGLDYPDDELVRSLLEDDEEDDEDNDEYNVVLDEISKSALTAIGFNNEDSQSIGLMGTILLGISSEESDDAIAGRAFAQLALSGFMLPMEDIKKMCKDTREKCKKQLFGLQIAMNSLREYHCSAEEALTQISMFL